jgi:transcriptional regulator with XRE-family HTH domain
MVGRLTETSVPQKSPSPIDKHVGNRVRVRRLSVGMSQSRLAAALGITFQQVQKYENGTNRIGASRLHEIAGILGVGVTYFYEGLPEPGQPVDWDSRDSILTFLALPDSDRLVRNFVRLNDDAARRRVTDLVEWLAAATAHAGEGKPSL